MIAIPRAKGNGRSESHRIALAAKERLRQSLYSSLQDISCACDEAGVLFLQGRLPSFYYKQIAQETVLHLKGVAQVVNQIEVVEPRRSRELTWL